jgi:hypothetical protein
LEVIRPHAAAVWAFDQRAAVVRSSIETGEKVFYATGYNFFSTLYAATEHYLGMWQRTHRRLTERPRGYMIVDRGSFDLFAGK